MATLIGTNFSYKAEDFLDERQGSAKTKDDLKNWSIPVPEGFEVCLDSTWYYYSSKITLQDTGHWIPKIVKELSDETDPNQAASISVVKSVSSNIDSIKSSVQDLGKSLSPVMVTSLIAGPMYTNLSDLESDRLKLIATINGFIAQSIYSSDMDINKDGILNTTDIMIWNTFFDSLKITIPYAVTGTSNTYWQEVGSYILPKITWKVINPSVEWSISGSSVIWSIVKGSEDQEVKIKSSTVVGSTTGRVGLDNLSWGSSTMVTSNYRTTYTYTITSTADSGMSTTETYAYFKLGYKTYTGVSDIGLSSKSIITQSDLSGFIGKFTETGTLSSTDFNCTGGKYPYILIPSDFYRANYNTYVSKNLNSDFLIKDVQLKNTLGVTIDYKLYRTTYIQTGNPINIEIK